MPSVPGTSRRSGSAGSFTIPEAAGLAAASYSVWNSPLTRNKVTKSYNKFHVQAYLLKDDILLIPGSNSAWDYLLYNFRMLNVGGKTYKVKHGETGEAIGRLWHQGFLAHANLVNDVFKSRKPKFIIGHSLGAASAQILSLMWGVPAIAFAAPRLYAGGKSVDNSRKCLCIWRGDDPVGSLPGGRFVHAGKSVRLGRSRTRGLLNHNMRHYIAAINDPNHRRDLPARWPA